MITFEQAMENALAVYVQAWFDEHPELLTGVDPEAVTA